MACRIFCTTIFLCLTLFDTYGQSNNELCSQYCNFRSSSQKNIDSLIATALIHPGIITDDTAKVQRAIEQILCIENRSSAEFTSLPYDDFNACAIECYSKKYIFYNTAFLQTASDNNSFAMYGILAHEIGHHVLGNAWVTNVSDPKILFEAELAADEYAGKILGRLNVKKEDALKCFSKVDEAATLDHPAKKDREQRFILGWETGQKRIIPDIERVYDLNCQTNIRSNYKIAFDATSIKRNIFTGKKRFTVYIEPIENNSLHHIDSVKYYLHPTTFKPNIFTTKSNKKEFALSLNIFGEFELRATIYMKDGSEFLLVKYLNVFDGKKRKGDVNATEGNEFNPIKVDNQ